jgi:hypothetical protein
LSQAACVSGIGFRSRCKNQPRVLHPIALIRYNALMESVPKIKLPSEAEMASYGTAQFITLVQTLGATVQSLQSQLEWFRRQMFDTKSERLRVLENAHQLALGEVLAAPPQTVPAQEHSPSCHSSCRLDRT